MDKGTILKAFNNQFEEFIEDALIRFNSPFNINSMGEWIVSV